MTQVGIRRSVPIPIDLRGTEHIVQFVTFDGMSDGLEHLALVFGAPHREHPVLVRLHSECLTGDIFGSCRCDCGPQLADAMAVLAAHGGVLLYMRHEGRGIGLYNKLDAYALQDRGHDTFEANRALGFEPDLRDFSLAADMLRALDLRLVRLLTHNPDKIDQLERHGITVAGTFRRPTHVNCHNRAYLHAKHAKARHTLML
jgi:GTP cyclohydrolase II